MEIYKNKSDELMVAKIGGTIYTEEWRCIPIDELGGLYEVSSFGRVRSCDRYYVNFPNRVIKGTIRAVRKSKRGYLSIILTRRKPHFRKSFFIHRLVGLAFLETIPGKEIINHKTGIKIDNHFSQLEWCTIDENIEHSVVMGLAKRGVKKRVYIKKGFNPQYKKVINIATGEIYTGVKDIVGIVGRSLKGCRRILSGERHNNTDFRYLGEEYKAKFISNNRSPINPVAAFDLEWNFIKKYKKTIDAANDLGIKQDRITGFINGETSAVAGKYKFKRAASDGSYIEPKQWISKMPVPKPKRILLPKTASKIIIKCDIKGNEINRFASIGEAGRSVGDEEGFRGFFKKTKTGYYKGFIYNGYTSQ